jgi:hypothetical protein
MNHFYQSQSIMKLTIITNWCITAALISLTIPLGLNYAIAVEPNQPSAEQGIEVLTRGPVHEAFAETVTFDPEPGIVAPKAPPAAIEELPPDQKPEGTNVAWIPGYWAWDDERNDFLWVSGIWRALPPGRQWVPGYWGESAEGAQWISGYWADATASEVEYLPEPPTSVETGPNIAAPSQDQTWMPGCWVWQQGRYFWRPGYWATAQTDWDWVPAHYVWAPRGYVYVDGYWDYSVARRGVLFAPVYFDANVYAQRGFSYSPAVVINPAVFASQLFLRPRYQHYYFGDYYGSSYSSSGYHPWFSYNSSRFGYDPIYAQQRWQHRQDRAWEKNVQADFQNRVRHENARPPRTWGAQLALQGSNAAPGENRFVMAAPFDEITKSKNSSLRFQAIDQAQRQQWRQQGQGIDTYRKKRQTLENNAPADSRGASSRTFEPAKAKFPTSPIMSKPNDQLDKAYAPPKAHQFPQADIKVEPKPRTARSANQLQPYKVNKVPQTEALPRVNQKPQALQVPPKRESPKVTREPKQVTKEQTPGKPRGGAVGNPAGKSNDKPSGDKPKSKSSGGGKGNSKA